uniref:Uncharacterized protein n=1 Tax=Candidatus Kentrum sp. LFY TaxID=2126342 RepID=A0A450UI37_9GAMM|nr:MAG: hypothetical protein BECKLFY1418A_GA0070994_102122 [Candidatus Kentron sp. LFY]
MELLKEKATLHNRDARHRDDMGKSMLQLKIDTATIFLPVAITRGFRSGWTIDFSRYRSFIKDFLLFIKDSLPWQYRNFVVDSILTCPTVFFVFGDHRYPLNATLGTPNPCAMHNRLGVCGDPIISSISYLDLDQVLP